MHHSKLDTPHHHPIYWTNRHKHESQAGLLHFEIAKPLKKKKCWFYSWTFEDKKKREWWRNGNVLSFAPFVSRLSLPLWAWLCIEALCGLVWLKSCSVGSGSGDWLHHSRMSSFFLFFFLLSSPWDDLHLLSQRVGSLSVSAVRRCSLSRAAFCSACRPAGSCCFYQQPHGPCAADSQTWPVALWQMTSHFCFSWSPFYFSALKMQWKKMSSSLALSRISLFISTLICNDTTA